MKCIECGTTNLNKRGFSETSLGVKQRYKCLDCGKSFSVLPATEAEEETEISYDEDATSSGKYIRTDSWIKSNVYNKKIIVVTAAQNNTDIDEDFYNCLINYVERKDANLLVIPIKYKTVNAEDDLSIDMYDSRLESYLIENTLNWEKHNLKIYAGIKIQATAENPLSGLDPLSKGSSIIIGHAQVQLKTLPTLNDSLSSIITSTGAVTQKNYSNTKMGEKARFNHSLSAVVLEFDENTFHLRHLNYDPIEKSFCDLDKEYTSLGNVNTVSVEAVVTGDEHALFRDELVEQFTYLNRDSLVNVTKPAYIVRHDVLDSYSASHHHRKNIFTTYAKFKSGFNSISDELDITIKYLNDTTPEWSKSLIVQSNHNEHLLRWLNEVDIRTEPWNALIYHYLMYSMLQVAEMGDSGAEYPDPFQLFAKNRLSDNIEFISRRGHQILGIEIGTHGDYGVNGARGSAKSFARMPSKTITGHSHSPVIEKGAYVVGTSSKLRLEYNKGASTWRHAHCIIHKNGKRQLIFITPDGWRLLPDSLGSSQ